MTAATSPPLVTLPEHGGVAAEILRRLDAVGDRSVLLACRAPTVAAPAGPRPVVESASWDGVDLTAAELAGHVRAVAAGLRADGVVPGDRVALLGGNTVPWVVLDLAVLAVGAVVVPIYPTSSRAQIEHVLADSGARRVFAESPEQAAASGGERFTTAVPRLAAAGRRAASPAPDTAIAPDDVATVVYTSGTTGPPKGCVLTHRNLFAAAGNVVSYLPELFATPGRDGAAPSTLLFLPLSHVFGRVSMLGCLWAGVRTGLLASAAELTAELPHFRPSFLVLVPYALEKLRKGARAVLSAEQEAEAVAAGAGWSCPAADTMRAGLGGRLAHVICGGAPLDPTTAAFTEALGIQVLGAYGLTESTTVVSMSSPHAVKAGKVGRVLPGCEVRIADDGEIQVRGETVSPGYWPTPAGTEWLRTGDLGSVDADGFLTITGRRKEIIVTSGGKNVAPEPLEDRIRLHPGIAHAVVVGEGMPYVAAVVFTDGDADVRAAVEDANSLVSRAESIRRWVVVEGALSVGDGTLTPSLKLRRTAIAQRYAEQISTLYP